MVTGDGARRRNRRYISLVVLVVLLCGGWSAFWYVAAGQAQKAIAGWRAREALAGRVYTCGQESLRGFPFRIEVDCARVSAAFKSGGVPFKVETGRALVAAQIYQPGLLISEFQGPLTFGEAGKPPSLVATWKLAQSSVAGTPAAPERVALVFDKPVVARMDGERAGRSAQGRAPGNPRPAGRRRGVGQAGDRGRAVDEAGVAAAGARRGRCAGGRRDRGDAQGPEGFLAQAVGGALPRNPGRRRLHRDQSARGSQQGDTVAVGAGQLSLTAQGYLQGTLTVTASGLEHFLNAIGADMAVKNSPEMDKVAGFLDRLAPGLGNVAREQAGAHITFGIKAIEGNSTLEGKPAVTLPLTFNNGAVSLGPIPLGRTPSLF